VEGGGQPMPVRRAYSGLAMSSRLFPIVRRGRLRRHQHQNCAELLTSTGFKSENRDIPRINDRTELKNFTLYL
jgi:hypothetical protein